MSSITTDTTATHTEKTAVEQSTAQFRYVAQLLNENIHQDKTVNTKNVTGSIDELIAGLRQWLLSILHEAPHADGWYLASLVERDENGAYDPYLATASADVLWFWGEECLPRSRFTTTG